MNDIAGTLEPLALDLLNAVGAHIAVLDTRGVIVAVNEAWRRFASENGGDEKACGVGANYLDVCERAAQASDDESAAAMHAGIEALAHADKTRFSLEYPCHSPTEQRWFLVEVTRFSHAGAPYLVAVHENITARKRMEAQLMQANAAVDAANRRLQEALEREQHMARTDDLTGLKNRRHFFELAGQMFAVAKRYKTPFCVVMFDLDHFKRFNDRFGHQAGDEVLRCVAAVASGELRAADVLARYGGEEFIVAIRGGGRREGLGVAEKIRERIVNCNTAAAAHGVKVTASAGIAELRDEDDSLDHVIRRADEALYEAKRSGRNCSVIA